ncbi:MAG TPA: hypothetical protein V6D03_14630 [Candidatus Caenarcaniphilales bacterium]
MKGCRSLGWLTGSVSLCCLAIAMPIHKQISAAGGAASNHTLRGRWGDNTLSREIAVANPLSIFRNSVRDKRKGKATPQFLSGSNDSDKPNPPDYDVPGPGGDIDQDTLNQWGQPDDQNTPWRAAADIQFANGQKCQSLPLTIFDDDVPEGKESIKWDIDKKAPFGFSKKKYTFREEEAKGQDNGINVSSIQLCLGKPHKETTIVIEDNDPPADQRSSEDPASDSSLPTSTEPAPPVEAVPPAELAP